MGGICPKLSRVELSSKISVKSSALDIKIIAQELPWYGRDGKSVVVKCESFLTRCLKSHGSA